MAEQTDFQFYYDGDALEGGVIDARDLAPSLLALADLLDAANQEATGGKASVALRVRSDFRDKCFEVNLSVALSYYQRFVDIFYAPEAQAWAALCSIVGVSGFGLLQFMKSAKGRSPKRVLTIERSEKVRVEFEGDDPLEIDKSVYNLFRNHSARKAVAKIVEPIERDGYEELGIRYKGEQTLKITKEEAPYFRPLAENEDEIVSESQAYVRIVSMSFREGNKWRVDDGDSTKSVDILDDDFLARVRLREELFGHNDYLRVDMRTRQWREEDRIKVSHAIIKVLRHEAAPKSGAWTSETKRANHCVEPTLNIPRLPRMRCPVARYNQPRRRGAAGKNVGPAEPGWFSGRAG
jgi:hypothetical protein